MLTFSIEKSYLIKKWSKFQVNNDNVSVTQTNERITIDGIFFSSLSNLNINNVIVLNITPKTIIIIPKFAVITENVLKLITFDELFNRTFILSLYIL